MKAAKKDFSILNSEYVKYSIYNSPTSDLIEYFVEQLIINSKRKRLTEKHCIFSTAYALKCEKDYAETLVNNATENLKLSLIEYIQYGFYKLDLQEQYKKHRLLVSKKVLSKNNLKEKAVFAGVYAMGWSYDESLAQVTRAKELFDITNKEYLVNKFYTVAEENKAELVKKIMYERVLDEEAKEAKDQQRAQGKKMYVERVMAESGWSKEEAIDKMNKALGVVESKLIQHPEMRKLSTNSVNTLRIVTISTNNPEHGIETHKTHFIYGGVRMSGGDSMVDNLHSGGMIAALDLTNGTICTPASNHLNMVYHEHPTTGTKFEGFKIPFFKEALAMIDRKITELDIEGYYGWDIAITADGPVLVEGNNNPGSDGLQTPYAPFHKGMKHLFNDYI